MDGDFGVMSARKQSQQVVPVEQVDISNDDRLEYNSDEANIKRPETVEKMEERLNKEV